jgi:hypothetical protein
MVGMAGFEPTTFRSQSGRATNLRHIPSSPDTRCEAYLRSEQITHCLLGVSEPGATLCGTMVSARV